MTGNLVKRALDVWLLLITVESIHGIFRTSFLVPVVGDFRARQISVFIGSAPILLVAYLLVGWLRAPHRKALMLVGLLWLVLAVAFEFGVGHFVFGRSWERLGEDYDLRHGGMLPFGLVVLVLSPWIVAKMRNIRK